MSVLKDALTADLTQLARNGGLCVAFSGGVDSALLVKLACDAGISVHAVTFDSTLQPAEEAEQAARQARNYGAKHSLLHVDPLADEDVRSNSRERCYRCKYTLFARLCAFAQSQGIETVIDGSNGDDLGEYRPGLRALGELGIISPLAKRGISKAQVREIASEIGLDVAKKPSSPCLATRFPYDTPLTADGLHRVGEAEAFLRALGFPVVRVRVHDAMARIEVPEDQLPALIACAQKITGALQTMGFERVTADLAGFCSGSFDKRAQA